MAQGTRATSKYLAQRENDPMGSRPCESSFAMAQLDPALSLSLSHAEKSGDAMVGSQGAPVRFCCRRRLCFMPPSSLTEWKREGERRERRRRGRKRMIERFEDGEGRANERRRKG